ncbi:MAG: class I SAM-dependent methyltransferase [Chloroflexota bacterium]|nr:class I SAM-dependent methyltransferase [Chloroflexota bacterium]
MDGVDIMKYTNFISKSVQSRSAQEKSGQRAAMQDLFTYIASRYDLVNGLLSWGQAKGWRQIALQSAAVPPAGKLSDVGTGTGEFALAAQGLQDLNWQLRMLGTIAIYSGKK